MPGQSVLPFNWDAVSALISFSSLILSGLAFFVSRHSVNEAKRSADASEQSVSVAKESLNASVRSANAAEKAVSTSIEIFKKQGVIDLFESWEDLHDINPLKPITTDVVRALRALELTASLWNHDIVEKKIIHQSFWEDYKHLYDAVNRIIGEVPGLRRTGPELLTRRVSRAYKEMDDFDTSKEATSNLNQG